MKLTCEVLFSATLSCRMEVSVMMAADAGSAEKDVSLVLVNLILPKPLKALSKLKYVAASSRLTPPLNLRRETRY